VDGLRIAKDFTQIPWVKDQFISKLAIDPFPGTLNLEIEDPQYLELFNNLKKSAGLVIQPEDSEFCSAVCYCVRINSRLKGAIVFPLVEDYPEKKLEIVCAVNVRETLALAVGDEVELETLK
jgi:CTP-dependent riboflavin kinase